MNIMLVLLLFLISVMIGSISFARIITKIWSGKDVTSFEIPVEGSNESYKVLHIGATSVSSVLGPKAGMLVSTLDIIKVALPVLLCRITFSDQPYYYLIVAIGGMIGHVWPIYHRFHGGGGFSAVIGGLMVIDPLSIIVTNLAGLFLGMLVFKQVIVATLGWLWLLIPWFWWRTGGQIEYILYSLVVNIIFILAMIPEIKIGLKYHREGKIKEYRLGTLSSNPMGRGFIKMARAIGFLKEELD